MSKEMYSAMDAFLALRDIDDDDVVGMLKSKNLQEGKAFSIQHGSQDLEAAKEFLEEEVGEVEIEVIDVDADSVDHIKNNQQYIGQGILRCNRCMANRFVDMDTLVASESDSEVYNVDDECPHCHDAGAGYTLVGQVGKVEKAEPEQPAADETDAVADNDEAPAEDEATFENDLEADQEESDDTPESGDQEGEENVDVDFLSSDDEESDGMETDTSEDELDDLDLPALGDETEEDVTEDDDEDVSVKESYLNEDFVNKLAEDAWMMNRVISSMNNEEAYYGGWLYIWPDGETKEMCSYDFGDQESYDELRDTFLRTYKFYHADGLYAADPEVVEYAHKLDAQLHLAPIENLTNEKLSVNEDYAPASCEVVGDLLNMIASPENIDKIIVVDMSDENAARDVFTGKHEDLPINVVGSPCKSFDVQDGYLTCNIDTEAETGVTPLRTVLEMFGDDKTEKVLLWDQASGDEVFSGTKEDAINQFGSKCFVSFETPAVIKVMIMNPSVLSTEEIEDQKQETDLEKLVTDVINANNLSVHKINKPVTNEYWINDAIMNNEDVDMIFETFVRPLENKELTSKFKALTGYTTALDEAFEAGFKAASEELGMNDNKSSMVPSVDPEEDNVEDKEQVTEAFRYLANDPDAKMKILDAIKADSTLRSYVTSDDSLNATNYIKSKHTYSGFVSDGVITDFYIDGDGEIYLTIEKNNYTHDYPLDEVKKTSLRSFKTYDLLKKIKDVASELNKNMKPSREERTAELMRQRDVDVLALLERNPEVVEELKNHIVRISYKIPLDDYGYSSTDVDKQGEPLSEKSADKLNKIYDHFMSLPFAEAAINAGIVEDRTPDTDYDRNIKGAWGAIGNITFNCPVAELSDEARAIIEAAKYSSKNKNDTDTSDSNKTDLKTVCCYRLANALIQYFDNNIFFYKAPAMAVAETKQNIRSFKSRKELSEAIEECKNNNKAYTVRRSTLEGFRYDLVLHEGDDTNAVVPARHYTPVQKQVMDQIHRIAHDIADSVNRYYGIDADPAIVVADILQDLKLVSGEMDPEELADTPANNLTKQMYRSYEDFYAFVDAMFSGVTGQSFRTTPQQKLEQAKQMLFSKAFSTEAIDAGIASTQFLNAVRGGNVAYIPSDTTPLLPENLEEDFENLEDDHVCETCGCTPCECILEESVDVNVEKFDEDMNAYFLEAYDSAVLYTTTSGEVKDNGEIILEGVINFIDDEQLTDVKFTLTPDAADTVYESVDDFSEDLTYRVTNNLSEEVFEFSFKDTLDE